MAKVSHNNQFSEFQFCHPSCQIPFSVQRPSYDCSENLLLGHVVERLKMLQEAAESYLGVSYYKFGESDHQKHS